MKLLTALILLLLVPLAQVIGAATEHWRANRKDKS